MWGGVLCSAICTGLIWLAGPRLKAVPLLPDRGPSWYYWRLPDPTVLSRATAWGLYALHQVALWALIGYAQTRRRRYTAALKPVNVVALGVNALFVALHLLQPHVWYDGLAQDVSIYTSYTSQGSVVLLLVWVLLLENGRRGLVFGRPAPLGRAAVRFARTYHGYLFAWATVYTFWYHPTVATPGHLVGFFYMFLLLLQGSLFFTRAHRNRWWTGRSRSRGSSWPTARSWPTSPGTPCGRCSPSASAPSSWSPSCTAWAPAGASGCWWAAATSRSWPWSTPGGAGTG